MDNPTADLALKTINLGKQALIFVNTKSSAEKTAEDISKRVKNISLKDLSEKTLKAISTPTKQCKRLSKTIEKGIAFHHSGLTSKQRHLIEDNFRNGIVKIICCTPTLAYGLDLPAFRSIIKDLKRYGGSFGMTDIPVLEYLQMAGRAGRPGKEKFGEAICIATTESQKENIEEKYLNGIPENIYSKLAVEPVLRTYLLSLISSEFVNSKKSIMKFFEKTFWAFQFQDLMKLEQIINKMLQLLEEWEFIITKTKKGFVKASEIHEDKIKPTLLGKRVAELYLDPLTANQIIKGIQNTSNETIPFSYLQLLSATLEIRPQLRVKTKEYDDIQEKWIKYEDNLLMKEPSSYSSDFDDFLNSIKTALFLQDWIEEKTEDYLLETYSIRPGELNAKINIADWLLYATEELARIMQFQHILNSVARLRLRLKHGAREELLPLLKLKKVGRKRARLLFNNGLKTLKELKAADQSTIAQLIGSSISKSIKEQLGQEVIEIKQNKRKGQISLLDY